MIRRLRPRPSRVTSPTVNVAKTLLQITVFWGFFLWVLPTAIVAFERALGLPRFQPQAWIGGVLFAVMGSIGFCSGMIFAVWGGGTPLPADTTTRFLILGPYRWIRNPMAVTGTTQGIAVGLILCSPLTVLYSVVGMVAWNVVARPWEEADLERRFGDRYRRYRAAVPCWRPRLSPYPREVDEETTG